MSWPLVQYVLTAAVRDRLILSLIAALIVSVSISIFVGTNAVIEKDSFALVFAGSSIRLAGVIGLVLFTVFFIRRSFEARDVEFLLARPVSRVEFLLSYCMGLTILALILTLAQGLCLYLLAPRHFDSSHMIWLATMALENIIMVNVSLFFSMILISSASAAMAVTGFYVLARMMGQLLGIISTQSMPGALYKSLENMMEIISALMPRLDLMGQSSWLIYDVTLSNTLLFILGQGLIFTIFILLASLIDLVRRQF